jgi:hypothetical protein
LERLGATHLVIPSPSRWWLDQYRGFADHLRSAHAGVDDDDCVVFAAAGQLQESN